MKERRLLMMWLLVAAVVVFLLPLAGCGAQHQALDPPEAPNAASVREAYQQAVEAYGWFDLTTMPLGSETREVDGMPYQKVDHPDIGSLEELETHLRSLFSEEITGALLEIASFRYRDLDGELYALSADRGTDLFKGEETRSVRQENEDRWVLVVDVEILDEEGDIIGMEAHEFPYEMLESQWVFTSFYLVR